MTRNVSTRDRRRDGLGAIDTVTTWGNTSADLVMSADTMMSSANPTTNYGSDVNFQIGEFNAGVNTGRALLKPDFSVIPAGNTIISAILKLTPIADFSDNARTLRVYRCLRNWVELQATWNIFSTGNAWATAGCGNNATDYDGAVELGNVSVPASPTLNTPISITLLAAEIQKMFDGTYSNYGFFLKVDTETDDMISYASRSNGTVAYRPVLSVLYP